MGGPGPTLEQIIQLVGGGSAFSILAFGWWLEHRRFLAERRERLRVQALLEGYLPTARSLARSTKALSRVVAPDEADEDDG